MLLVLGAILVSTAAGVFADRRLGERSPVVTGWVMKVIVWGFMPPIVFFVIARQDFSGGVGAGIGFAYIMIGVVGAAAYFVGTRVLALPRPSVGALICCTVLVNTGYLGVPLVAALLGHDAIRPAVAYDSLVSNLLLYTLGFGIGAAFGTRAGVGARERVRSFFTRNPVLFAAAAAFVAPDGLAPDVLLHLAETLALVAVLPLGFFLLGANLVHEEHDGAVTFPPPFTPAVGAALGLRMALGPAIMVGLSAAVLRVPHAYIAQAAMPSGINTLIVAHLYGLDVRLAASTIAWSTVVAVVVALVLAPVI